METNRGFCMIYRGRGWRARPMEIADLQKKMLQAYGIRVEPEMARYALRRLKQAGSALRELPVIGGNARNGAPPRAPMGPAGLIAAAASSLPPPPSPPRGPAA